jgi:hypothetical protein
MQKKSLFSALLLGLGIAHAYAASVAEIDAIGDPVQKGLAIAHETKRLDSGYHDFVANAEMILKSADAQTSVRKFHTKALEIPDDGDHSINVFDSPGDVAGTAILVFSHGLTPDDQWLYMPAIKRVKRISTRSKSGPFVGSEFAYEDISTWVPEKYTYRYLGSEPLDGADCFKVANTPAFPDSGYSLLHEWVDKKIFRPRKIDYFDRKGALLKTLSFEDYKLYNGHFWRAGKMTMVNHQTGRSTVLLWKDYKFGTGLTKADLTEAKLME